MRSLFERMPSHRRPYVLITSHTPCRLDMKYRKCALGRLPVDEEADLAENGRRAWARIRKLNLQDLQDPSKVTLLPYPGLGTPSSRPGGDILVVGMRDVALMLQAWEELDPGHRLILVGGKGVGKSVRLRILACILYATLPKNSRLFCIWDMNSIRSNLFECLANALLFTYCEDTEAVIQIKSIVGLEGMKAFLSTRKTDFGEMISFILDGAEALDAKTSFQATHRDAEVCTDAVLKLESFLLGCKALWALSPKAERVGTDDLHPLDHIGRLDCDEGFDAEAMQTYMSISTLGAVIKQFPHRRADVQYFASSHPWFLQILDECCRLIACEKELQALRAEGENKIRREVADSLRTSDVANLLEDKEDWEAVLHAFVANHHIKSIRKSLEKMTISKPCYTLKEMACEDPRYALDVEQGLFCSPFIEAMYIDAFREKEQELDKTQRAGPWVAYSKLVLRQPIVNWAELGWICERLCTDVVSRMGVDLGDGLVFDELKSVRFSEIPNIFKLPLKPRYGIIYVPHRFNFGQVDAVIIYHDLSPKLHFIGLQITTNLEKHKHSKDEFMSVSAVEQWIPSAVQSVCAGEWSLHYAFICMTSEDVQSESGNLCDLRGGAYYGTLAHKLHVRSFSDALGPRRLGQDVHNLLIEMAQRREQDYSKQPSAEPFPPLPPGGQLRLTKAQLGKLKRAQLDAIALAGDMVPKKYRTIDSLVAEMTARQLLVVI